MSKISEKISSKWRGLNNRAKRRFKVVCYSAASLALVVLFGAFYQSPTDLKDPATVFEETKRNSTGANAYLNQTSEANLAAKVASASHLSIENNVAERLISITTKEELAQTDETVITKPILSVDDSNNAITRYVAVDGDTASGIAGKFGITAQTVKWANNLLAEAVDPGATLLIPVVDGVVYTVKEGDTIDSIVEKYGGSASAVLSQNNLAGGLKVGEAIVIPDGVLPTNERPGYNANSGTTRFSYASSAYTLNIGTSKAGNNYSYGYCTWYAYNRRVELGMPAYRSLGNANTWDNRARAAGITVSNIPIPGAIFQTDSGYYGHVGIVESVNSDGTINISDMNGIAGWNRVGFKNNVSPYGYLYIY
jgi:surface antigen